MIWVAKKQNLLVKLVVLGFIFALLCFLLGMRLFYMQVLDDEQYSLLSAQNRIRILSLPARRGNIYDANMTEMAVSKPVFAISLASADIPDREALAEKLAALLHDEEITAKKIQDTLAQHYRRYEPVVIKRLPYDEGLPLITRLEEMRDELPGILITEEPMRYYPQGSLAGHILGTVGRINSTEYENLRDDYNYLVTDWIGKNGVEKSMERFTIDGLEIGLRGKNGMKQVEVNAKHRPVRDISTQEPRSGDSYVLTIDGKLQNTLEQSLADMIADIQKTRPKAKAGAAVMINVKTGAILAMASYPPLDPNDFANGLSQDKAEYYYDEAVSPLLNRCIAATYPPGSTFKPMTAVAALACGAITPKTTVNCSRIAKVPRANCTGSHGAVNLQRGIAVSCNTYFQEIGYRAGIENLDKTGSELGLGQQSGIDLPGESAGVLPSPEWKAKRFPDESNWEHIWRPYDTFYMSMGQGYNMLTPLQMANYIAAIANGGKRMRPHVVDKILSPEGELIWQFQPEVMANVEISEENLAAVCKAMRTTVTSGTAGALFRGFPIEVAAKTGTAQTGLPGDDKNKDYHGVFVAFAPFNDPEVAFAGIIEYGYHGSTSSGYVCRAVFDEYFGMNE